MTLRLTGLKYHVYVSWFLQVMSQDRPLPLYMCSFLKSSNNNFGLITPPNYLK